MDLAVRSWMPPMAHCPHEEQWFNSSAFATAPVILDSLKTHGVNNAQAVKHGVVWARQSGEVQQGFAECLAVASDGMMGDEMGCREMMRWEMYT